MQFRRDMLGTSANLPVGPMTDSIDGAAVSVGGKLPGADPDWIALENEVAGGSMWVPRRNVLMLRNDKN